MVILHNTVMTEIIKLGKATKNSGSATVKNPNAYGFSIQNGNLVLLHRDFVPNYRIENGNLIFTQTSESTPPSFTLKADGVLVAEGAY